MRKAFNTKQQPLPVIPPPDAEALAEDTLPEDAEQEPPVTNEEMFIKSKQKPTTTDVVEENSDLPVRLDIKEKKKRGQRGKDKGMRKKRPPTEKQLAHLKRIRGLALAKKRAIKEERDKICAEAREKIQAAEDRRKENRKYKKKLNQPLPPPTDVVPPVNKKVKPASPVKPKSNGVAYTPPSWEKQASTFFDLMDAYETRKEKRRETKKKEEKPQEKTQPHPNKLVAKKYLPRPPPTPPNPYDICFGYTGRWNQR